MENKERQILSEIKDMMASLRSQMEALEAKVDELQHLVYQEDTDNDFIDPIDLDIDDVPAQDVPEPVEVPDDDLPFDDIPEPVAEPEPEPKVAVIDSMTDRQAWRTDMAGTHVRDIRSAISLNDRILFINTLFDQDPMAFQESLTKINQMTSLDEVVSHVVAEHPEWDLESETVYRFMMAVRRKVEE